MRGKLSLLIFSVVLVASFALPAAVAAQSEAWQQAYQAFQGGEYRKAEGLLREVVEDYPEWGWGHMMLGLTLQKLGNGREALAELQTAKEMVDKDEDRFNVNHNIAQIFLVQGNYDSAITAEREAEKYAQSGQQRSAVAYTLGRAYYYKEQWGNTVQQMERAAQGRNADAMVHAMLGRAQYERGNKAEALERLNRAIQIDRNNRLALYFAGLIHLENREYSQAVRVAERAVQADPQDTAIRNMLGRAYLGAGRYDEAVQAFRIVLQDKPTDASTLYNLGQAYMSQERWAEAIREYQKAVNALEPGSSALASCLFDLGFSYEKAGNYEDSLQAFNDSAGIATNAKVTEAIERVEERIKRAKQQ